KLQSYFWPGNIRELENVIQRALIVSQGNVLCEDDLVLETPSASNGRFAGDDDETVSADLKKHERALILQALREHNGSRKYAAESLGISPRTLRYKLSKMREQGVDVPAHAGTWG